MTKKTFRNSAFKDYVIQVKLINEKWHIFCKHVKQDQYHLCYVEKYGNTWTCITDPKNNDTYRMFDYDQFYEEMYCDFDDDYQA